MEILSKRLHYLRELNKLSQKDMAKKLNISIKTYVHYEYNENTPKINTLIKIADIFGVTVDYLVGHNEKPSNLSIKQKEDIFIKEYNEKGILELAKIYNTLSVFLQAELLGYAHALYKKQSNPLT